MPEPVRPFSDEQVRILINLQQQYDVWMSAERAAGALAYGMVWKHSGGRDYLAELIDRNGNAKGLGVRSAETEALYDGYVREKARLADRRRKSLAGLRETCLTYRALGLPMLPAEGAKIAREADRSELMGSHLLVVGTNALAAYAIEAGGFIQNAPAETLDFDLAWSGTDDADGGTPVLTMLRAADATYTMNSERTFQMRNAAGYEVELLAAPSRIEFLRRNKRDRPLPIPLPEQEWLLLGRPLDRVVVARDASPARIVVPDPRWFALQKLWLSAQDKRDPLKRPKDERQGMAILDVVARAMPRYPIDAAFEAEIPDELAPHYERWRAQRGGAAVTDPGW
jgi:hypothetical protein